MNDKEFQEQTRKAKTMRDNICPKCNSNWFRQAPNYPMLSGWVQCKQCTKVYDSRLQDTPERTPASNADGVDESSKKIKLDLSMTLPQSLDFLRGLTLGHMDAFTMCSVLDTLTQLKADLATMTQDRDDWVKQYQGEVDTVFNWWSANKKLKAENEELRNVVDDENLSMVRALTIEVAQLKAEREDLKEQLHTMYINVDSANSGIEIRKKQITKLEVKLKKRDEQLRHAFNVENTLEDDITKLEAELTSRHEHLGRYEKEIVQLKADNEQVEKCHQLEISKEWNKIIDLKAHIVELMEGHREKMAKAVEKLWSDCRCRIDADVDLSVGQEYERCILCEVARELEK